MISSTLIVFAILGLSIILLVGRREHAALRAARRGLLDDCPSVLTQPKLSYGGDDFPRLEGRQADQFVRAELIPDTMTIRRLPQLWLALTRLEPRPSIPEFAALVRPAGAEFYSLTSNFTQRLDPPADFVDEVLMRGSGPRAQWLVNAVGPTLNRILSDPKVKEIAVTRKGLRLVWQAGEGRRGEHLLLRQCAFDEANVAASTLEQLLARLDDLSGAVTRANDAYVQ